MTIASYIRTKATQVAPLALFGVLALLSAAPARAAINGAQLLEIQDQLQFISSQVQLMSSSPAGEVLGASTTVAVRPACSLTLDKKNYVLGNQITVSWSTSGGTSVEFIPTPGQEGKDNQSFPTGKLPSSGSRGIMANVLGLPSLSLRVTSQTGNTVVCTRYFSTVRLGTVEKDVAINQLYATLLQLQTRIESLQTQYTNIGDQINATTKQINETNVKIARIQNATTTATSTGATINLTAGEKGANLVIGSTSSEVVYGKFFQNISIQARGATFYVPLTASRNSTTKAGVYYQIKDSSGIAVAAGQTSGAVVLSVSGGTVSNGYLKIPVGTTATLRLSVPYTPTVSGAYRLQTVAVSYGTTTTSSNLLVRALSATDYETKNLYILANSMVSLHPGSRITPTVYASDSDSSKTYGMFTEDIEIQANEDPVYVPLTAIRGTSTKAGVNYVIEDSSGFMVTSGTTVGASLQYVTGGSLTGNYIKIQKGRSAHVQLIVPFDPAMAGSYRLQAVAVGYALDPVAPTSMEATLPAEDFETARLFIVN